MKIVNSDMRTLLLFCCLLPQLLKSQSRPNIIYIMSDDHDNDAISAYNRKFVSTPNIDRLAREGMLFNKAFVGNSICSPARATLLTGQHSHMNGVKDNRTPFDTSKTTIAHLLSSGGYQTALVGKWHLHSLPKGFQYWHILPGQGLYFDPRMIRMNGDTVTEKGYTTNVINQIALEWLDARDRNKPFALFLHHKAPHRNFVPPLKYLELFHTKTFPEPPSLYNDTTGRGSAWKMQTMSILADMKLCGDLKVDPDAIRDMPAYHPSPDDVGTYNAWYRRLPENEKQRFKEIYSARGELLRRLKPVGKELLKYKYQWFMQDFMASVASIDENVGKLLDYLDKNGLTENTVVIYTGDQGFYLGENGWFDKRFAYDVSMQAPLLVRWPGKVKPESTSNALVQNIDFAPTILDLAGIKVPGPMQGVSLKTLLTTGSSVMPKRKYLYYHYYEYGADHTVIPHVALRSDRYKIIYFYTVDEWEFYDLNKDPGEQKNLINNSSYKAEIREMRNMLDKNREYYKDYESMGNLKKLGK